MTGHRPFSELQDKLRRRIADRDTERQRIWEAIQAWTEIAHRLDSNGEPVAVEGTEFRPLAPFFDELHAMVFPDEYLTDDEVRAQLDEAGRQRREGRDDDAGDDEEQDPDDAGEGAAVGAAGLRDGGVRDLPGTAVGRVDRTVNDPCTGAERYFARREADPKHLGEYQEAQRRTTRQPDDQAADWSDGPHGVRALVREGGISVVVEDTLNDAVDLARWHLRQGSGEVRIVPADPAADDEGLAASKALSGGDEPEPARHRHGERWERE